MPSQEDIENAMNNALAQQACGEAEPAYDNYALSGLIGSDKATKRLIHLSLKNNLAHQRDHHMAEAKRLSRLITLLEANPEVQEILELSKGF